MRKFISNLSTLRRSLLVSAAAFVVVATAVSATTISTSITTIGLTATGSATLGDAVADGVILNGRLSTGSAAGAALTLDSTYAYTEGAELRYTVTDWTGIGDNTFEGIYLRPQINTANASGNLKGIEVNTVNNGVALGSIHGGYFETQMKAISADTTVGPIYGIESQISQYAPTSGTLTLTEQSNVGAAAGRFQIGLAAGLADYTSLYGVLIQTNDASAASRTLGSGLLIRNYPAEGTQTWTKGIQITAPAVTGISLEGAMTTDISLQNGETIDNATDGGLKVSGWVRPYINNTAPDAVDPTGPVEGSIAVDGGEQDCFAAADGTDGGSLCVYSGAAWIVVNTW